MSEAARLEAFGQYVRSKLGCSYIWFGKADLLWTPTIPIRSPWPDDVFDCCGLMTCGVEFAGGPDWRFTENANSLWHRLTPTLFPRPWDWVFYGTPGYGETPSHADHVECMDDTGRRIGAIGGGKRTLEPKPSACVQYRVNPRTNDFLGYRINPLREPEPPK